MCTQAIRVTHLHCNVLCTVEAINRHISASHTYITERSYKKLDTHAMFLSPTYITRVRTYC
jgi:hypothetical protein